MRGLSRSAFSSSRKYVGLASNILSRNLSSFFESAAARGCGEYDKDYKESVEAKEAFWKRIAEEHVSFDVPFKKTFDGSFGKDLRYFVGGKLNASYNCVDRHIESGFGDRTAITWEGDDISDVATVTYATLHDNVNRMANTLKRLGVGEGDAVVIYMPNSPEAVYAMLGFSAEALQTRILHLEAKVVITTDTTSRSGKSINLKSNVAEAVKLCRSVKHVLVHNRKSEEGSSSIDHEVDMKDAFSRERPWCPPSSLDAEHPLFVLYTSGSTGAPKGLVHSTGGYLCFAGYTHSKLFDFKPGMVHGCMADIGWITGHTYIVYGPLMNKANTVMFEGVPTYPDVSRYWSMVERHKIDVFYTSPTALRSLVRFGDGPVKKHDRSSLKVLGSVGEPLNASVWEWYFNVVGEKKCSIVDTYWQTETGGAIISPLANVTPMKPGSASLPLPGVELGVVDGATGKLLEGACDGLLVVKDHWPGVARTCFNAHTRYQETYFSQYNGLYFTGDGVHRDADGYYFVTGRVDDVIKKSGHRIGTAEVESALVKSPHCAEAAVVGIPDEMKGESIVAFCSLKSHVLDDGEESVQEICADLKAEVRKYVGGIATPDYIIITNNLPKTRSGKIMRRILRKIAEGKASELGDLSTLADPAVIPALIKEASLAMNK